MERKRILAVASAGGHWVQLQRLRPAFENSDLVFVTTNKGYRATVQEKLHVVHDANLTNKLALAWMFLQVGWILLCVRPHLVITTGAAPGFAAIVLGKLLLRSETIWIDSIANSEELSTSGKKIRPWADAWLTQWPHLQNPEGPTFWGGVL